MNALLRTIKKNTSSAGMGFAGTTGLIASGLTDIASSLGPFLPWFFLLVLIAAIVTGVLIQKEAAAGGGKMSSSLRQYCNLFLVSFGSLFGSGMLLLTGLFVNQTSGSNILSLLHEIRAGVARVEVKVDTINQGVEGIGQALKVQDISGRSGTGMIGDLAVYRVSLVNEKLMENAECRLILDKKWQQRVSVVDSTCEHFTVKLPTSPILDEAGNSMGDIVQIPFELQVLDPHGKKLASYAQAYSFNNKYRHIVLNLEPAGNHLKLNERRKASIQVRDAEIPDNVACQWGASTIPPITFEPVSENKCKGWLSTEAKEGSYAQRKVMEENEVLGSIYIQLVARGDFTMLGIKEAKFSVSQ